MTSTIAHPGPFDPTAHSAPDEPYFPLVAHDPDAPATVRHWCDLRRKRLSLGEYTYPDGHNPVPEPIRLELVQITEADQIADAMDAWRKGQDADARIEGEKKLYNEIVHDEATVTEMRRKAAIAIQVQNLREAAYYAQTAVDGLMAVGALDALNDVRLVEAIRLINSTADVL